MGSYDVVQRMMKKEFEDVEKEVVCPLQVMKYLIQHNALLPKNWNKGESLLNSTKALKICEAFSFCALLDVNPRTYPEIDDAHLMPVFEKNN